jgi:hypothetical protein
MGIRHFHPLWCGWFFLSKHSTSNSSSSTWNWEESFSSHHLVVGVYSNWKILEMLLRVCETVSLLHNIQSVCSTSVYSLLYSIGTLDWNVLQIKLSKQYSAEHVWFCVSYLDWFSTVLAPVLTFAHCLYSHWYYMTCLVHMTLLNS